MNVTTLGWYCRQIAELYYVVDKLKKHNLMVSLIRHNFDEFTSGGLHEKHRVAAWKPSPHLLEDGGKPRKPATRWPVAGPSGCILTTSQQFGRRKI
jgi:hypothetical protein